MILLSLTSARNGMLTAQRRLSRISHDVSNVQTTGFKDTLQSQFTSTPSGEATSLSSRLDTSTGPLKTTDRPLDLTARGDRFIPLQRDGELAVTSSGSFHVDRSGRVVHSTTGDLLQGEQGPIQVPSTIDTGSLTVKADGTVVGKADGTTVEVGRVQLVSFQNPGGLKRNGGGVLMETANSGEPQFEAPTGRTNNRIQSGILEQSNVDFIKETTGMMNTQTAFRLNARHFRVKNQMLRRVASLI